MFVDSNGNRITVEETGILDIEEGRPLLIVRLVEDPSSGYICSQSEGAMFGDESCPSSWGMACQSWFGVGERFPDAKTALEFYSSKRNGEPELDVTWNIPTWHKPDGKLAFPVLDAWDGRTFGSLDELREYCRARGIRATVTPCRHSADEIGGYRYLHDKKFIVE